MRGLFIAAALAIPVTAGAHPHRYIDQQVQLSVGIEAVDMTVVIVPSTQDGAAMYSHIDSDGDGVVSDQEAQAFGADVLAATELTVDGRAFVFAPADVKVPEADAVAKGTAAIIVNASAHVSLAGREAHRLDFGISYEAFSHDWFVQPFIHPDLLENTSSPSVDRTGGEGKVVIRFSSP
jgi:hypothetical protein